MRVVRLDTVFVRAAALVCCAAFALPAQAQEASWATSRSISEIFQITAEDPRASVHRGPNESAPIQSLFPPEPPQEPRRPPALLPLYGSLIALQGLDFHSTRRALDSGSGREANPAMRQVVGNGTAFLAVKAGATAGVIWASEKMWKKNRKGAVIFATIVNAAMAAIVANNYRISR